MTVQPGKPARLPLPLDPPRHFPGYEPVPTYDALDDWSTARYYVPAGRRLRLTVCHLHAPGVTGPVITVPAWGMSTGLDSAQQLLGPYVYRKR